jgi:hypothetical protein
METILRDGLQESTTGPSSILEGHFGVVNVLGGSEVNDIQMEDLGRHLAEMSMKNRLSSEDAWDQVLRKLGDKSRDQAILVKGSEGESDELKRAVGGLKDLLSKLDGTEARTHGAVAGRYKGSKRGKMIEVVGPEGELESIWMDSTRRKRRKKITKHKYKKRRKVGQLYSPS